MELWPLFLSFWFCVIFFGFVTSTYDSETTYGVMAHLYFLYALCNFFGYVTSVYEFFLSPLLNSKDLREDNIEYPCYFSPLCERYTFPNGIYLHYVEILRRLAIIKSNHFNLCFHYLAHLNFKFVFSSFYRVLIIPCVVWIRGMPFGGKSLITLSYKLRKRGKSSCGPTFEYVLNM